MRVRWIGDARLVPSLGYPVAGQDYDVPEDVGASLCEQGKAVVVTASVSEPSRPWKPVVVTGSVPSDWKPPAKPAVTEEEE